MMEDGNFADTIKKTERSMEHSFDKIFREIEKTLCDQSKKVEPFPKRRTSLRWKADRRIDGQREFKKAFGRHWKKVEELYENQAENRRNANRVLRKHSKSIIKKWQKELVDIKLKSDQLKEETEKFNSLLNSTPDITQRGGRVPRLHHHLRNSHRYITREYRKELKSAFENMGKSSETAQREH